jgi:hypothetical protein
MTVILGQARRAQTRGSHEHLGLNPSPTRGLGVEYHERISLRSKTTESASRVRGAEATKELIDHLLKDLTLIGAGILHRFLYERERGLCVIE